MLPAEQVGVDAGLPTFWDVRKTCQFSFWETTLIDDKCNDTIPFFAVKVIVFGCNERVVLRYASKEIAGLYFHPLPANHLVMFVDWFWYFEFGWTFDVRGSWIYFKFKRHGVC